MANTPATAPTPPTRTDSATDRLMAPDGGEPAEGSLGDHAVTKEEAKRRATQYLGEEGLRRIQYRRDRLRDSSLTTAEVAESNAEFTGGKEVAVPEEPEVAQANVLLTGEKEVAVPEEPAAAQANALLTGQEDVAVPEEPEVKAPAKAEEVQAAQADSEPVQVPAKQLLLEWVKSFELNNVLDNPTDQSVAELQTALLSHLRTLLFATFDQPIGEIKVETELSSHVDGYVFSSTGFLGTDADARANDVRLFIAKLAPKGIAPAIFGPEIKEKLESHTGENTPTKITGADLAKMQVILDLLNQVQVCAQSLYQPVEALIDVNSFSKTNRAGERLFNWSDLRAQLSSNSYNLEDLLNTLSQDTRSSIDTIIARLQQAIDFQYTLSRGKNTAKSDHSEFRGKLIRALNVIDKEDLTDESIIEMPRRDAPAAVAPPPPPSENWKPSDWRAKRGQDPDASARAEQPPTSAPAGGAATVTPDVMAQLMQRLAQNTESAANRMDPDAT